MRSTDARCSEPLDLVMIGHHAMRNPRAVGTPARAFEILHWSTSKGGETELIVFGILGEVGMQADVEPFGELS